MKILKFLAPFLAIIAFLVGASEIEAQQPPPPHMDRQWSQHFYGRGFGPYPRRDHYGQGDNYYPRNRYERRPIVGQDDRLMDPLETMQFIKQFDE